VFRRYVAVGRDYEGRSIMALDEYQALEAQLNDACPERFAEPSKQQHPEFASTYFRFLEACIARCAHDARFESDNPAVGESIDELLTVLAGAAYEVVCCRHVSHLTTTNGDECRIQGVTVVPEQSDSGIRRELIRRNLDEIPGAARHIDDSVWQSSSLTDFVLSWRRRSSQRRAVIRGGVASRARERR
jgi:hypothetical protein